MEKEWMSMSRANEQETTKQVPDDIIEINRLRTSQSPFGLHKIARLTWKKRKKGSAETNKKNSNYVRVRTFSTKEEIAG
jgi:hypothetical protein